MVSIFFDLEKAFDTTWKYGILKDLHSLGLRGYLPLFIKQFLNNRSFQTKVGSTLSEPRNQEEGVPQGSILSPILFEIKINSIAQTLKQDIDSSLYVDDFLICYKSNSKKIDSIERKLQIQLDALGKWADKNGFSFSPSKTVAVHFCSRNTCVREPELFMDSGRQKIISVKNSARFLGLIFDKKLTFIPHMEDLRQRCMKAMRVMKVLASPIWGADANMLLHIYRTLIRSKLDYASFIYGSARTSYLQRLDPIHNMGIRLALGSYRTSSVGANRIEADEPNLQIRRQKLALQYTTKLKIHPENPAHKSVFSLDQNTRIKFNNRPKTIPPLGMRIEKSLEKSGININSLKTHRTSVVPPWTLKRPSVDTDLTKYDKNSTDPHTFKQLFKEKIQGYKNYKHIYTDGSKIDDAVGCAFSSGRDTRSRRLDDGSSIFTAESTAIKMALDYAEASEDQRKFLILTDSLSCLISLGRFDNQDPRVGELSEKIHSLHSENKEIAFLWIPSHVGIQGNEKVDRLAKNALRLTLPETQAIFQPDVKPLIKSYVRILQKDDWTQDPKGRKLYEIKTAPEPRNPPKFCRREEVILTRLRISHTRLTHGHLLSKTLVAPLCEECDTELTVEHFLVECQALREKREKYYKITNIKDLLSSGQNDLKVLSFLRETPFYKKI